MDAQGREAFNNWQPSANLIRLMWMLQRVTYLRFDLHSAAAGGRMENGSKYQVKIRKTVDSVQGSGKFPNEL